MHSDREKSNHKTGSIIKLTLVFLTRSSESEIFLSDFGVELQNFLTPTTRVSKLFGATSDSDYG